MIPRKNAKHCLYDTSETRHRKQLSFRGSTSDREMTCTCYTQSWTEREGRERGVEWRGGGGGERDSQRETEVRQRQREKLESSGKL